MCYLVSCLVCLKSQIMLCTVVRNLFCHTNDEIAITLNWIVCPFTACYTCACLLLLLFRSISLSHTHSAKKRKKKDNNKTCTHTLAAWSVCCRTYDEDGDDNQLYNLWYFNKRWEKCIRILYQITLQIANRQCFVLFLSSQKWMWILVIFSLNSMHCLLSSVSSLLTSTSIWKRNKKKICRCVTH